MVNHIFKGIVSNQRIIRLAQNDFYPIDLLYNFTFTYQSDQQHIYEIESVNGIFPEIGAFLAGDGQWQTILLKINPLKYNQQYSWIERLLLIYKRSSIYSNRHGALTMLRKVSEVVDDHILPYVKSINKHSTNIQFWKNPHEKMLNHWSLISDRLKDIRAK